MARAKFKVESILQKTEGTGAIKGLEIVLTPVAGTTGDETITMTTQGSNPNITVTVEDPDAATAVTAGSQYYITFTPV